MYKGPSSAGAFAFDDADQSYLNYASRTPKTPSLAKFKRGAT
jgi:hypothetical protein